MAKKLDKYVKYSKYGNKYNRQGNVEFFTVEAYKIARTNIALSVIKSGCKKIAFTSSVAGEGKTTTSCNIAAAFSKHLNCRTLLIDCDLRKPTVGKFFNIKNTPGLTNVLSGMCTIEEAIQIVPNTNLSVICSGIVPPNPSELLSSSEFYSLVDKLSENYDYIIFDTPPVNIVVDAIPVIEKADGVVIVTYEEHSNYVELDKAVETLNRCGSKILGFVLNGSRTKEKHNRKLRTYRQ
ncbi:MAG: CpsD/CapB family tyrosine-protein kinase [Clostridiales bacterium]|nr:CpsD/CapB family tyrosine-protein kinase [Clostridiales bacterium]